MREYRFRAKEKKTGKWVFGHYTQGNESYHYITKPDGAVWAIDPETLGEYTGKKDCKGNDIYEGDIIDFDRTEWGGNDNTHVVSWDEEEAEWNWGGGATSDMEWRTVIGNIHEEIKPLGLVGN